jgi:isopenicillin N synthase-like dioxygenase
MGVKKASLDHLINQGYMFFEVDLELVQAGMSAWKRLIAMKKDLVRGLPIVRKGEPEADLGLIVRPGAEGGDYKYFFHLAHDFFIYMSGTQKMQLASLEQEFKALEQLRKYLNKLAFQIAERLDAEYEDLFGDLLLPAVQDGTSFSVPYATTTLRSLWYPPALRQTGAGIHIDRSLFTIHLGDEGGLLLGHDNERGDGTRVITPPKGYVAVFFGVKALYLSDGKIQPLWHSSTVEEGKDRFAMVHFVQASIGFEVRQAKEAYKDFYDTSQ